MKAVLWPTALLLCFSFSALAAPASCERVKADIEQRIIHNGVDPDNFSLSIVANDQAEQPGAQVVGHCANDTFKILYQKGDSADNSTDSEMHTPSP
ncbi:MULTISPECIES: DUF1161 domain-containing protein [Mangrovibacter]|uniref:Uncharacterized protein DUF1161 n=1 Tax=Mangrovibacter plantisponsor TaxID=451513 RepID=A0A317Q507_9ENTR|nr:MULTISPECIES: DUF1161 domain-containing protein [Mangrovibacter]KEA51149.1 hypothetical protein DT73_20310 [Mangrovibacter sp. MFB070]PWW10977.1 uncharacterized protein DUF1161 [Mangrovibacter plantisponsor]